jgi:hypothetical protein
MEERKTMTIYDGTTALQLPYQDRKMIIVTEESWEEKWHRQNREQGFILGSKPYITDLTQISLPFLVSFGGKGKQANGPHVLRVKKDMTMPIKFPLGHPKDGFIYVGHPHEARLYYPMADYHRSLFEHKLCEAIRLLKHLGASELRVEYESGWSTDFCANLSVPPDIFGKNIAGKASAQTKSQTRMLFEAKFWSSEIPSVPTDLVWYPDEPLWQEVADGRLNRRLKSFSMILSYSTDFGIDAGLAVQVKEMGFEVGGTFKDYQSTVWRMAASFGA